MGQTLYAIIAMMIVSLFALHQQRHAIRTQMDMIDNEINTIASGVAVERLEEVSAFAFDQKTKGGRIVESPSGLTAREDFGSGEGKDMPNDDLDDFDNTDVEMQREVGGQPLVFEVHTTVDYADPVDTDQPREQRGKYKLITVTVSPKDLDNSLYSAEGLKKNLYTLSQSVSCKSACQW